ncbi:iron-uptake system-binding protein [Paenibacillus sp. CAA11]|uniref:ABC transporter substrate-binding protein n=1 Tax=Paenibacillus sp. CAA11 TaxID=1532905 RepID=UPI000D3CEE6F|nr:ABC transporter substrate-binding protein [Paenibacillus sp. CAA11]AWB43787.1 iron-uptake system-binding protein [Paenibacillus sp. CAA11]
MKRLAALGLVCIMVVMLAACGKGEAKNNTGASDKPASTAANTDKNTEAASGETRTVKYLDKEYTVPANVKRIVITGSMESMEDALVLDVHPVGAITFGGKFPERFAGITAEATPIGEKTQPNFETILSLKPDVILGSTKFKPEVAEQLSKIGTLIQVSHIATDWEANLQLLGELTGKQEQAQKAIAEYKSGLDEAKAKLGDKLKDKKVVAVRVRTGKMYIYPEKVFFNPVLYGDLGLTVPAEIKAAKAQEELSVEKFAEMNPDYLFIQYADDENKDTPNALKELQNNPIIQKTNAVKEGHAFVNVIDPLSEGGPAWSRSEFLKAAVENLSK